MQPNLLIRGKTPDPSYTYADDSSVQLLDDSLLEQHDKEYSDEPILGNRKWVSPTLVLLAAILFFVCSIVLLVISATYRSTDQECVARLNVYCKFSPLQPLERNRLQAATNFKQRLLSKQLSTRKWISPMPLRKRVLFEGHQTPNWRKPGISFGNSGE